jgi:hypothetical protein
MTTSELISHYTSLGWAFKQVSWPSVRSSDKSAGDEGHGVEIAWQYESPATRGIANLLPDSFTESDLLRNESECRVRRDYAAAIYTAIREATNGVVQQLGVVYRLKDRGKVVPVPESIVLHDVVVRLTP